MNERESGEGWRPYVSMTDRRRQAARIAAGLRKQGRQVSPVRVERRELVRTFWGQAWCDNLLSYSDFANRLPRGQRYVRNGAILDLQIAPGLVAALVSGSQIYTVEIEIRPLARTHWSRMVKRCAGKVESAVELLRGKLDRGVMEVIARRDGGLFPAPRAIAMTCTCPDWAVMCKHVAAALYGVGVRLDDRPELLFALRGVDHLELIQAAPAALTRPKRSGRGKRAGVKGSRLGGVFGIELEES